MIKTNGKTGLIDVEELLGRDEDFLRATLEAEVTETIGAAQGERTETWLSYRGGCYGRSPITRVGTLELRVPQDRLGRLSTELFQRYQAFREGAGRHHGRDIRSGCGDAQSQYVSEALCGRSFSVSAISRGQEARQTGRRGQLFDRSLEQIASP